MRMTCGDHALQLRRSSHTWSIRSSCTPLSVPLTKQVCLLANSAALELRLQDLVEFLAKTSNQRLLFSIVAR